VRHAGLAEPLAEANPEDILFASVPALCAQTNLAPAANPSMHSAMRIWARVDQAQAKASQRTEPQLPPAIPREPNAASMAGFASRLATVVVSDAPSTPLQTDESRDPDGSVSRAGSSLLSSESLVLGIELR
jgi:hypothetical protein